MKSLMKIHRISFLLGLREQALFGLGVWRSWKAAFFLAPLEQLPLNACNASKYMLLTGLAMPDKGRAPWIKKPVIVFSAPPRRPEPCSNANTPSRLEGTFDVRLDGTIAPEPGSHLDASQRVLRTKIVAAVEHVAVSHQSSVISWTATDDRRLLRGGCRLLTRGGIHNAEPLRGPQDARSPWAGAGVHFPRRAVSRLQGVHWPRTGSCRSSRITATGSTSRACSTRLAARCAYSLTAATRPACSGRAARRFSNCSIS